MKDFQFRGVKRWKNNKHKRVKTFHNRGCSSQNKHPKNPQPAKPNCANNSLSTLREVREENLRCEFLFFYELEIEIYLKNFHSRVVLKLCCDKCHMCRQYVNKVKSLQRRFIGWKVRWNLRKIVKILKIKILVLIWKFF